MRGSLRQRIVDRARIGSRNRTVASNHNDVQDDASEINREVRVCAECD